ncbi:B12-binding domain-containing radical SAM protein [candidate division CSSED10-310 bacterium]|uniref:B12-binding domain-containing radical SAM protein n=1 Tax=candidate division CSSED10-310 bacterium TaxID=2855610 RepID=A0ABV6Z5C5_UNCC1
MNQTKLDLVLINPPSSLKVYSQSRIKAAIPVIPLYSIALLAAEVRQRGYTVRILNLAISRHPELELRQFLSEHCPRIVGITFATPLYPEATSIAKIVRSVYADRVLLIGGGVHPTSLPEETLSDSEFDVLFLGEADETLPQFLAQEQQDWISIPGLAYKQNGKMHFTARSKHLQNLDDLPFPAWDLFDLSRYKSPRITSRRNPVGSIITSRGCIHRCIYCNKNVLGNRFRALSPLRVVDELEFTLQSGFHEIHIWDDQFSTDLDRAKQICELIIRRGLKFPWNIFNGIRVNSLDEEFLRLAKKAGCYSISFGVESGNQKVLDSLHKDITLEEYRQALSLVRQIGMETVTYFMIGLPGETEGTMQQTIDFAMELNADYAKVAILVPLPDTDVYHMFEKEGRIKSRDWSLYNYHLPSAIFQHPQLTQEQLSRAYYRFYRQFYFRPSYILRQFVKGITQGRLIHDFYYMIKTFS